MHSPANPAATPLLQWRGACGGFNLAGRTTGAVLGASCWVAGLAVLVEKRSGRMELALYLLARVGGGGAVGRWWWCWHSHVARTGRCVAVTKTPEAWHGCQPPILFPPQAAESFALSLAVWGVVRPSSLPRRLDVLLFSLAAGEAP